MKLKKTITGAIVMVLAGMTAYACRPGGHFQRFCGDGFPDHVLSRIDGKVKDLNLTGAQLDKYNEIKAQAKTDLLKMRDEKLLTFDEVKERLAKTDPDLEALVRDLKKRHEEKRKVHEEKMNRYFDQVLDLYRMLNKDQQAKIADKLRDAMKRFDCR